MSFDVVKLCSPVKADKFNWFQCSKKVYDENIGYIIKISPHVQFFNEETGKTYKATGLSSGRARLLITDKSKEGVIGKIAERAVKNGLDGAALELDKESMGDLICNAIFVFKLGILKEISSPRCKIISYAKRNNSSIRVTVENFPTCKEIDSALEKYSCKDVSKVLYKFLQEYFSFL